MNDIAISRARLLHAADACCVLRRSIAEVCGPDYSNDPSIMAEWLSSKTPQNVGKWIEDDENYAVVAKRGDTVVGFALIRGNEILLNYVVPEFLGKGVGHMMLETFEAHAESQGFRELHCTSTITARSFYTDHDFEPFGKAIYVGKILGEFPLRKRIGT